IVLEAFINIGSMLVLIPFAGNALPLISYGGSSLITTLFGVGIILSIARKNEIQ
ncbi:MAG: FtsW/RodA/SpoVE family cell cycle protein, partial [Gammaproteobacteria bacterium]|nr:FtsW/RodA/SpoVE family cell cycle protein [Gammaproteobacteria bacterium]